MNICDFVKPIDFERIRESVASRRSFEHIGRIRVDGTTYSVQSDGVFVDKETADKIWNGHEYLVRYNDTYSGKAGYGGHGFATDKLDVFSEWGRFKDWFDRRMKNVQGYETEEYGQIALF